MNFLEFSLLFLLLFWTGISATRRDVTFPLANDLKKVIRGYVFLRGSPDYETARPVHNGGCRHIYPLIIVKPLSTEDVALTVRLARQYGVELSVRSGGHSYQCTGTKQDSVHLDLRRLNKIEFRHPFHVVTLGPGAIFKNGKRSYLEKGSKYDYFNWQLFFFQF